MTRTRHYIEYWIISFFLLIPFSAFSKDAEVKGTLFDAALKIPVEMATVRLSHLPDSLLYRVRLRIKTDYLNFPGSFPENILFILLIWDISLFIKISRLKLFRIGSIWADWYCIRLIRN